MRTCEWQALQRLRATSDDARVSSAIWIGKGTTLTTTRRHHVSKTGCITPNTWDNTRLCFTPPCVEPRPGLSVWLFLATTTATPIMRALAITVVSDCTVWPPPPPTSEFRRFIVHFRTKPYLSLDHTEQTDTYKCS